MDRSHTLAVRAAEPLVASLAASWDKLRAETGVIVGFAGKTRRGVDASLRIYLDFLKRRLAEVSPSPATEIVREAVFAAIGRVTPSGPYTLPGLMPNVMTGRVANAFHLTGPNMVLDADQTSLYESLREAARLIRFNESKLVFAGAVSSCGGADVDRFLQASGHPNSRPTGEAVVLLALVSSATASELNLPVLGYLSFGLPENGRGVRIEPANPPAHSTTHDLRAVRMVPSRSRCRGGRRVGPRHGSGRPGRDRNRGVGAAGTGASRPLPPGGDQLRPPRRLPKHCRPRSPASSRCRCSGRLRSGSPKTFRLRRRFPSRADGDWPALRISPPGVSRHKWRRPWVAAATGSSARPRPPCRGLSPSTSPPARRWRTPSANWTPYRTTRS